MQQRGRARLHELWEIFADQFPATPWLSGERLGALDILAATVSKWSGARKALAASRPEFAQLLARIEAEPRVAAVWARHWPEKAERRARRDAGAAACARARRRGRVGARARAAAGEDDLVAPDQRLPRRARELRGRAAADGGRRWRRRRPGARARRCGRDLADALTTAGYRAARGDRDRPSRAPPSARGGRCADRAAVLPAARSNRRYSEIGVARSGDAWRIILAQPLLPADLGDWRAPGGRSSISSTPPRAEPRSCGGEAFRGGGAARLERRPGGRGARAQPRHGRARLFRPCRARRR